MDQGDLTEDMLMESLLFLLNRKQQESRCFLFFHNLVLPSIVTFPLIEPSCRLKKKKVNHTANNRYYICLWNSVMLLLPLLKGRKISYKMHYFFSKIKKYVFWKIWSSGLRWKKQQKFVVYFINTGCFPHQGNETGLTWGGGNDQTVPSL